MDLPVFIVLSIFAAFSHFAEQIYYDFKNNQY